PHPVEVDLHADAGMLDRVEAGEIERTVQRQRAQQRSASQAQYLDSQIARRSVGADEVQLTPLPEAAGHDRLSPIAPRVVARRQGNSAGRKNPRLAKAGDALAVLVFIKIRAVIVTDHRAGSQRPKEK